MPELFGTDGIRGRAYEEPLDEATVRRLGAALARRLGERGRVLLAGDTRASTDDIAGWLGEALAGGGLEVVWAGVLPTPAVSHLLRAGGFDLGVVISASHNPAEDNGIKVLAGTGEKLPEAEEEAVEALMASVGPGTGPPLPAPDRRLAERYLELLAATLPGPRPLEGLEVVLDAAHGAAFELGPRLLERLGATVHAVAAAPDGHNINAGCGATTPDHGATAVRRRGADAGLSLDGDADRAILVAEDGTVLDGDDILLAWARDLNARGELPGPAVVATVMSNYGLERALAAEGIELVRCAVGDRNVWLAMRERGAALGGEQSGHVICAHHAVTGDGLLTGVHLLAIARRLGRRLSRLSGLDRLPQVLANVRVARKPPLETVPELGRWIAAVRARLEGRGRLLLRYSGTEPVLRVMVEGEDEEEIRSLAAEGVEIARRALG